MRRAAGCSSGEVESWAPFWRGLEKAQITFAQIWSPFEDGNDATISKSLVCAIFVEVEPTLLLVIEEVKVLLGKLFLKCFFLTPEAKVAEPSMPKLSVSISRVSVEGLKLVICRYF